ncbi:Hypothetical predicted protein [Pelobates cultripes]|uniref:Uncharacterized protein n=1 Tax=Pelobates cultripes TaxID=61616 RepID=A0AAD1WW59_PELCU|nr:Hypothetical predicted protein [Pelobates cultripes]
MDIEDRSRRNNIRLRGVTEEVSGQELVTYVTEMLQALLPEIPTEKLLLDRIHRVPKPQQLPDSTPRDIIMRLHFFHIKEQILWANRNNKGIPEKFKEVLMFMDLLAETLRRQRLYKGTVDQLRHNSIPYRWGYPAKLIIRKEGEITTITTPAEGLEVLRKWDIPLSGIDTTSLSKQPHEDGRSLRSKKVFPKED